MAYAGGWACDDGPGFLTAFAELFDLVVSGGSTEKDKGKGTRGREKRGLH